MRLAGAVVHSLELRERPYTGLSLALNTREPDSKKPRLFRGVAFFRHCTAIAVPANQ